MEKKNIYRCFKDSEDGEFWAKYDGKTIHEILSHNFLGVDDDRAYENRRLNAMKTILLDSKNIYLNVENVKFPRGFNYKKNKGKFEIKSKDKISKDGLVHKLFSGIGTGGGYAMLLQKNADDVKLIKEGNKHLIQEYLLSDYLEELGINFKQIFIEGDITKFLPQKKHFR